VSGHLGISLMGTLAIVEIRRKLAFLSHLLENDLYLQSPFGLPGRSNMEQGEAHKRQSRVNFLLPLLT
jgi:hypothetical protein